MNLLIFGPPGAGKGTQSKKLVKDFGLVHISTGDLLREAIANKTELGLEAEGFVKLGKLVPDRLVTNLVDNKVKNLGNNGFIFDGYPRNEQQALVFDQILLRAGKALDMAIFLDVPASDLIKRLSGRRNCATCSSVYHVSGLTEIGGEYRCPKDNTVLYQRADDNEEIIKNRIDVYLKDTLPVFEHYDRLGKCYKVDGKRSERDIFGELSQKLSKK